MSDLHDIFYIREFQNNDSIPLEKFKCPSGTLLVTRLNDEDNVTLYCTCCSHTLTPGAVSLEFIKDKVKEYVTS